MDITFEVLSYQGGSIYHCDLSGVEFFLRCEKPLMVGRFYHTVRYPEPDINGVYGCGVVIPAR